jgi:hypothetical protein
MKALTTLLLVKLAHTVAWTFFASCILLLPIAAHAGHFKVAAMVTSLVLLEILILAVNRWRCPLTSVAARYTQERQDNFDIFLPLWLARYNKEIFGALFAAGIAYAAFKWWQQANGGSLG